MKRKFLLSAKAWVAFMIASAGLVVIMASCSKNDPEPEPVGELDIKAVNTVSGSPSQDFAANNVVKATAVAYGSASVYAKMTSGVNTVGFYNTGSTTASTSGQAYFPIGSKASAYLVKSSGGELGILLTNDETTAPTTGKAKVRFLHLNNFFTSSMVTVTAEGSGTVLVPSAEYARASTFFEVDPGTKFIFSGTGIIPGASFDGGLAAGKVYTIWIDGTSATSLTGHIVANN